MSCISDYIFPASIHTGNIFKHLTANSFRTTVVFLIAILGSDQTNSDEGGVPFWFSGQYASLAAVPATPGWSMPFQGYYYNGDAAASKSYTRGGEIALGLNAQSPLLLIQPTYAPKKKLMEGQVSLGLGFGYGSNITDADISISPLGRSFDTSDRVSGFTDLYPIMSVAWNRGVSNWMTYITGDIPVGDYEPERLSNLGIGHSAIDIGGGYTYLNQKSGREFSAVTGFTYNWVNTDTDYQNGIDSHIDWAVSQFVSDKWEIGLAGYVYYQLTGDSGSGAKLGDFKSRIAAIGPEVGYSFKIGGKAAYANVRGYYEFWEQNRLRGYTLFATLALPL